MTPVDALDKAMEQAEGAGPLLDALEALGFTVAPTQDAKDAEALRLLREHVDQFEGWVDVASVSLTGWWEVAVLGPNGRQEIARIAKGSLAEAADACRASLESDR